MLPYANYKTLLLVILMLKEILCVCEDSYIVICEDLNDIKQSDYVYWRHVQIGSVYQKLEDPSQTLTSGTIIKLTRVKSLTIIKQVKLITSPLKTILADGIEYLNFYQNNIIEIEDFTFGDFQALKEIYLKNNNIQHLGRAIFRNTNLEIVDLSGNRIESITTCFYESKISKIILNNNKINFIKNDAFSKTSLKILELNHNHLQHLEEKFFQNLKNLAELLLEHNHFTTVPDVSGLTAIKYLQLGYNHIKEVHYRFDTHLPTLEFLDLGSNLISNVTVDAFSSDTTPPLVVLAFNRLTNIEFEHPQKTTDLVLYGNPWNCDCWFQIEKILKRYKHQNTCEFHFFDKGDIPFCVDVKKCNERYVTRGEVDHFLSMVKVREEDIQRECSFRL